MTMSGRKRKPFYPGAMWSAQMDKQDDELPRPKASFVQQVRSLAKVIMDADIPERRRLDLERVNRAAKQVLANYDEFGVEGGLDEYMEGLRKTLREVEPAARPYPFGNEPFI